MGRAPTRRPTREALRWIADRVEHDAIDCDFRRRPSYAYVTSPSAWSDAEDEARAAIEAGLAARLVKTMPLPYPIEVAVRFEDQAEFHVTKYLLGLVARLAGHGCRVFARPHAVEVDTDEHCVVKTPGGRIVADQVVVATHYPFLVRSLAFALVHPQRSYAILCRIAGVPPEGMFISADAPTRSVRGVPLDADELLLVGDRGERRLGASDSAPESAGIARSRIPLRHALRGISDSLTNIARDASPACAPRRTMDR